jgi:superfamily II DNA or RNA helicase
MKAIISNRIYMEADVHYMEKLKEELTYKIQGRTPTSYELIKNYRIINDRLISVPVGREDLIPDDYEIQEKRVLAPEDFPEFKFTLRPSQQEVHDSVLDNCLINAKVSWGKSLTGLKIAQKLGQKTLIVTHNLGLRAQWEEEVEKAFGFKPSVIGSGKFETAGPIVVGNTQTLSKNMAQLGKLFGTLIVDECHRVPSKTFSHIVDYSYARYKIGLSGTLERKDGKHIVLRDFFGDTVLRPPSENYMVPRIDVIMSGIRLPGTGALPWATRMNMLTQHTEYKELITLLAAFYSNQGHKVLLLSDRIKFLEDCAEVLGERALLVTGKVGLDVRSKLASIMEEKDILLGTQSIFSEGISVNALSCLILATPVNNEPLLTQLIGRVVRKLPDKKQPVVVDIQLKGGTAVKQARARLSHYRLEGYDMRYLSP